jgi:hypothetical protein
MHQLAVLPRQVEDPLQRRQLAVDLASRPQARGAVELSESLDDDAASARISDMMAGRRTSKLKLRTAAVEIQRMGPSDDRRSHARPTAALWRRSSPRFPTRAR